MNRRTFLKTGLIGGAATIVSFECLTSLLSSYHEVKLPFLGGNQTVHFLKPNESLFPEAYADDFNSHSVYNYNSIAQYDQQLAYQQAMQQWQIQMAQWQQQIQLYNWMANQHYVMMNQMMQQRANYQSIGKPSVMNSIKSIYGFGKNSNVEPVLFGMNSNVEQVEIKKTLRGAATVWDKVGEMFDKERQEKTVGPQSSEFIANIALPDGSLLKGNGYKTKYGALGVSNDLIESKGVVGNLAKFALGHDNNKYLII
jgi:hypothetical protein